MADVRALPGVTAYGRTREAAERRVVALAERVVADQKKYGEWE